MRYRSELRDRQSYRLPSFDYRQAGAYFLTICTFGRACILEDHAIRLALERSWFSILRRVRGMRADEFVVMPNHVHGIIWIVKSPADGAQHSRLSKVTTHNDRGLVIEDGSGCMGAAPLQADAKLLRVLPGSLGAFVGGFKSSTTKRINEIRGSPGAPVWQRNYYEHIVRNEADLARIRQYIRDNPRRWSEDPENPMNRGIV